VLAGFADERLMPIASGMRCALQCLADDEGQRTRRWPAPRDDEGNRDRLDTNLAGRSGLLNITRADDERSDAGPPSMRLCRRFDVQDDSTNAVTRKTSRAGSRMTADAKHKQRQAHDAGKRESTRPIESSIKSACTRRQQQESMFGFGKDIHNSSAGSVECG